MDWVDSNENNVNALLIVAHPDDETIFCGGTLLVKKHWQWTVITVTYQTTEERYQEFEKAMSYYRDYGVNIKSYKTLGLRDGDMKELTSTDWQLWRQAFTTIGEVSPDLVITHNTLGEYRHPDHIAANIITHELFANVWEFICPGAKNYPQPMKAKSNQVNLTKSLLEKKKRVFNLSHISQSGIWYDLPDIMQYEFKEGPETFTAD